MKKSFFDKYPIWIILFILPIIVTWTFIYFYFDRADKTIILLFCIVYELVMVVLFLYYEKKKNIKIYEIFNSIKNEKEGFFRDIDLPLVIINKEEILWYNESFYSLYKDVNNNRNVYDVIIDIEKGFLEGENNSKNIIVDKKEFTINKLTHEDYYFLYFNDKTKENKLIRDNKNQKIVLGLILIDNYDELVSKIDDLDTSLFSALIDQKIAVYIKKYGGVVRKVDNEKYFIAVKYEDFNHMILDNFSIRDDMKNINKIEGVDNYPTLSIGFGTGGINYGETYQFTKSALGLATDRGGNQIVVKNKEKEKFFGGTKEREIKFDRVRYRVKAEAIRDILTTKDKIFIMGHENPDNDCIGASLGMRKLLLSIGKKPEIIEGTYNEDDCAIVENGKKQGVKFISKENALKQVNKNTGLIILDTNSLDLVESKKLVDNIDTIIIIDHHRKSSSSINKFSLAHIDTTSSSTSEMIVGLISSISETVSLTPLECNALYGGIVIDSNHFTTTTGAYTFEAAAFLRKKGADIIKTRKMLRIDSKAYKAKADAISNAELYKNSFAFTEITDTNIKDPSVIGAMCANDLLNISKVRASFVFTNIKGYIYISSRSIDDVNVQRIMEEIGGGGHISVAGARVKNKGIEELKSNIKVVIDKMIELGEIKWK